MTEDTQRPEKSSHLGSLRSLKPFVSRYRVQISLALLFLLVSTAGVIAIPAAAGQVIDRGFMADNIANIDRWFWLLFAAAATMAIGGGRSGERRVGKEESAGGWGG